MTDEPQPAVRFVVKGEPHSKSRARGGVNGYYTPADTVQAQRLVALMYRQAARGGRPDDEHEFMVDALFVSERLHRRDVDNMMKLVMDALNKLAWKDDSQVAEIRARKQFSEAAGSARTEVRIYQLGPIPGRRSTCGHCEREYATNESSQKRGRKYCSNECMQAARIKNSKSSTVSCAYCEKPFLVQPSRIKAGVGRYCSQPCRYADWKENGMPRNRRSKSDDD